MPTVTFLPSGLKVECDAGDSVFEVGRAAGVRIPTSCVGNASCGLCRVKIVSGEDDLAPFNANERRHLGNVYFLTKIRLSCQARVLDGDIVVALPE
jgi:2Fe-2S ferredoxin